MSTIVFGGGEVQPPAYPFPSVTPGGLLLVGSPSISLAFAGGPTSPVILHVFALFGSDGAAPSWVQRDDIRLQGSPVFVGGCGSFARFPPGSVFYAQQGRRLREGSLGGFNIAIPFDPPAPPVAVGFDSVTALFVAIASGQPSGSYVINVS